MSLHEDLSAWDLKSADDIGSIFDGHASRPSFLKEIVELLDEVPLQRGAPWLLKHHFDLGGEPIGARLVDTVYGKMTKLSH